MAEKVELFELSINVGQAAKDTRELKIQLELLKEQADKAKEAGGELSEEYIQYQAALKLTQKEIRTNETLTQNLIKAENANTNSIEQLRAKLSVVSVQWAKVTLAEGENSEESKKLTAQKLELTNALKKEEKATGDTRRNVGNYSEAIDGAVGSLQNLSPAVASSVGGFKQMTLAALKFIATPIGAVLAAIVAVFKLLQGAFNRSLASQEKLNKVTGKLSAAFGVVLDALVPVVEFILDNVLAAFEKMGNAVIFVIEKLEQWGIISEDTSERVKNAFDKSTQAADDLADAERRLIESNIQLQKLQLQFQTRAEKLRQIRDDEARSIDERIAANEELSNVLERQYNAEIQQANNILKIAQQRELVNGRTLTSIQEIGDAEIKLLEIQERITSQRSEQLANLNGLRRDQAALLKAQRESELLEAQSFADEEELIAQQLADDELRIKQDQALIEVAIANQVIKDKQDLLNKEKQAQILNAENQRAIDEQTIFGRLDVERAALEEKRVQEIAFAEKIGADVNLINQKYSNANKELTRAENDAKLSLASDFLGNIAQIAGEGTAVGKAAAIAQTTVSTYQAATGAYASLAGIPIVGVPLGIAAAGAAITAGLANVKKILAVKSGLPGDNAKGGGGATGGGGGRTPIAPNVNQGIVSRDNINNGNTEDIVVQPTLMTDSVTEAQKQQTANNKTAVI